MTSSERKPFRDLAASANSQEQEQLGLEMSQQGGLVSTTDDAGRGKRKRGAPKPAKDPNHPKRPMTAFFFYAQEERPKMRKINPDIKITEVSKELGKLWREMSAEEKGKYELMAKVDKKRYETEFAEYSRTERQDKSAED